MNNENIHLPILIDASSLIYLDQADALDYLLNNIKTYSTLSVKKEVTKNNVYFENIFNLGLISILPKTNITVLNKKMSITDKELIGLALTRNVLLLSDDGMITKFCNRLEINHLNSLSLIALMFKKDIVDLNQAYLLMNKIAENGRYSKEVIKFAYSLLP